MDSRERAEVASFAINAVILAVLRVIAAVIIYGGVIVGVWVPIAGAIGDTPGAAVWLIPLALFILTPLSVAIGWLVFSLVVELPLLALTALGQWLLRRRL